VKLVWWAPLVGTRTSGSVGRRRSPTSSGPSSSWRRARSVASRSASVRSVLGPAWAGTGGRIYCRFHRRHQRRAPRERGR